MARADYQPEVGMVDPYSQLFNELVDIVSYKLNVSKAKATDITCRALQEREFSCVAGQGNEVAVMKYNELAMLSPHNPRRNLTQVTQDELKQSWSTLFAA